ncbi:Non-canonical purine NTP phosphatase [Pseudoalteromonas sp. THAF3]|uniref:inosine/xanthosine triphosphatase n=1 Tax=Pseudoalteromonas TaxID=53246 RepID=UPI001109A9C4|nr:MULTISPECIES: inosine/xanthosine triphosphatase [Pseudoalteromonas]MCF2861997.1 inosine/xanthosine triphosphatase [Pseudoalteromonas sp. CNAT2-18]MCG7559630.1 inosine/xanthosine triphosphatase [Pseudoalteromonas sp. CNAT2-18.1]MCG7566571.1 inosine/xanthosine triphosphatase [Pseudoalteromonas sp. CnMc7-15]MCG7569815.1 inosine/xanthosine triphosphatase [Pseudoalteromonas sp. CNC9-20]QFU03739.1 Non-canonical purine NTP phosphatase [Pseudoalteromonas sp. THAF3]|tara:strand:- start:876 stop:1436 length:561 start_codon:yes stop_codon:yes gene_type:complete
MLECHSDKPITLIVGSKNPVKINAAKAALATYFPDRDIICQGVDAPSGVADQPLGEAQTLLGAHNRIRYCQAHYQGDYYMAMEGGAAQFDYGAATFAFVVIAHGDEHSVGRSCNLPLPKHLYQKLEQGQELGNVMDEAFATKNIKQQGGAIGLLTQGHATRQSSYQQALLLAMAPFNHSELFASTR